MTAPALGGGFEWKPGLRSTMAVHVVDETALAQTAARLGPAGVRLLWDRRVDAGIPVDGVYGDWRALLFDHGLAWSRHGDELHIRPAGVAAGDIELTTARAGASDWRVWKEETLQGVLARWAVRAGVEVDWRTDRRYRLHEGRVYRAKTFEEATVLLFSALGGALPAPVGAIAGGGGLLRVLHRGTADGDP